MSRDNGHAARIGGLVLSALVVLVLVADGATGLLNPSALAGPMAETGFPAAMLWVVDTAGLVSATLYAMPRTAFLGAILVTGFCGGAIATHVRVGEMGTPPQLFCLALGLAAWAGLYLRDPRLRALVSAGKR